MGHPPTMNVSERGEAAIFDLDGTLAIIDHRRHHVEGRPRDFAAFHSDDEIRQDRPCVPVIVVMHGLQATGLTAFICTGRPECTRPVTERWMARNFIQPERLIMRPDDDNRPDVELKLVMLSGIREEGYAPLIAVDDRDRLVAMWRSQGLVCLQAAPGDF